MKYGAEESNKTSTPADGAVDWMVTANGLYVLRVEATSYVLARQQAFRTLGTIDGSVDIVPLDNLPTTGWSGAALAAAIHKVRYIRAPKKARKPNPTAALRELNLILSSKRRWSVKTLRAELIKVTQLLCP